MHDDLMEYGVLGTYALEAPIRSPNSRRHPSVRVIETRAALDDINQVALRGTRLSKNTADQTMRMRAAVDGKEP